MVLPKLLRKGGVLEIELGDIYLDSPDLANRLMKVKVKGDILYSPCQEKMNKL